VESLDAQRTPALRTGGHLHHAASNVVAAPSGSVRARPNRGDRQIIAAEEKALAILRDQFRLGFAMRIDVAAQEAALAQAETLLPPLQTQLEQTRDLLVPWWATCRIKRYPRPSNSTHCNFRRSCR